MQDNEKTKHHSSNSIISIKNNKKYTINPKDLYQNKEKITELYSQYLAIIKENLNYQNQILLYKQKILNFEEIFSSTPIKKNNFLKKEISTSLSTEFTSFDNQKFNDEIILNLEHENKTLTESCHDLKTQLNLIREECESLKIKGNLVNEVQNESNVIYNQKITKITERNLNEEQINRYKSEISNFKKKIKKLETEKAKVSSEFLSQKEENIKLKSNLSKLQFDLNVKKTECQTHILEKKILQNNLNQLKSKLFENENELGKIREKFLFDLENHSKQNEKLIFENKKLIESFSTTQNLINETLSKCNLELSDEDLIEPINICDIKTDNLILQKNFKLMAQKPQNTYKYSKEMEFEYITNKHKEIIFSINNVDEKCFLLSQKKIIEKSYLDTVMLLKTQMKKKEQDFLNLKLEIKRLNIQATFRK